MIHETGIAESRHPGEVIVLRVIHAARASESPLGDGNAQVVVEWREVGPATWISHRWLERIGDGIGPPPFRVDAPVSIRIGDGAGDVAQRRPPRWRAPAVEARTLRRDVLVEIRHRVPR